LYNDAARRRQRKGVFVHGKGHDPADAWQIRESPLAQTADSHWRDSAQQCNPSAGTFMRRHSIERMTDMYQVIVVDDEIWICKLIRKIIDWEEIGFQIVGDAENGTAALALIDQFKPDLVITDIRMPGMDGINLIKEAREKKIDAEFIIISGFSDFEYARSAIEYDAFGYLLKPLDKIELLDILTKVKDKIDKKNAIRHKIDISEQKMLQQLMLKILSGEEKLIDIDYLNEHHATQFAEGKFFAAILKQDSDRTQTTALHNWQPIIESVKQKYAPYFHEILLFTDQAKSQTILIINTDAKNGARMREMLLEILTQCERSEGYQSGTKITIGLGNAVDTLRDIRKSYQLAQNAIRARIVTGTGKLIDSAKLPASEGKDIIDIRDRKKLAVSFDLFDLNAVTQDIAKIFKKTSKANPNNPTVYYSTAQEIIELMFDSVERKAMSSSHMKAEELCRIDECLSLEEMEACILDIFKSFCYRFEQEKQKSGNKTINEIKTFISENYMLNIGLDDVAKLVCLNPTYVSEIFKKKTGENFSEYLINYRMLIAKDLLKDVKYKITDVSTMVGYQDPKYFSRLFKQKVGVNPSDYRNLYL
jgi:two-component system, response regulator YesN